MTARTSLAAGFCIVHLPFALSHLPLPIRLLALDIDGTLLDSHGSIPDENRRAIARAQAAGVEVVLATGRRYEFARAIFENLPAPLTLILSNGAIVKTREGETLMRQLLPRATAREVLSRTPHHRETAAIVFDRPREHQVVFETIDWEHPRHRRFFEVNRPFIGEHRPLEDALTEDPVQVMFTGGCRDMRTLFELLRELSDTTEPSAGNGDGNARFAVALTEYVHRDFSLVDVVRHGCSKGSTLRQWAESRGHSPAEVMAVGDNLNDLEMLQYAGTPVVMGNGLEELRCRGWAVTASNDDAGVARAIEEYVLDGQN
jgi:hydroxymethylpyrimidine pyrophosphatase-like HAD family hydrolase